MSNTVANQLAVEELLSELNEDSERELIDTASASRVICA